MQEVFSSSVRGLPAPPQQDQEQPIELEQLQQQVPSRENKQSQSQGQEQVQHVQGPSESRTFPAMVVSSCESPPSSAPSLQRIRTVIAADEPGYLGPVAVIKDVLQPHDLSLVLEELEAQSEGFSSSSRSKHYRNTDRTLLRSSATAERLWLAVSHYFQKQLGSLCKYHAPSTRWIALRKISAFVCLCILRASRCPTRVYRRRASLSIRLGRFGLCMKRVSVGILPRFRDILQTHSASFSDDYAYPRLTGTWLAVGVSSVFRVNKYGPGQHFGPHYDGFNLLENGRRTFFTLVTYLETTAEEHGGATNFLRHDTPMGPNSDGKCAES